MCTRGYSARALRTRALRTLDRYYSIRVRHIKTRSPAKCVLNGFFADHVTYSQSRTFVQPLANPVIPAFDWISAYYTVLASRLCLFGRVTSLASCLAFNCQ